METSVTETWIYFQRKHKWVEITPGDAVSELLLTYARQSEDIVLSGVHSYSKCRGRECIIHKPEPRDMDNWHLLWREDRGIFERICQHGTGHPDKAQRDYWLSTDQEYQFVHGCCGCCRL
jgi:hypothetical protein